MLVPGPLFKVALKRGLKVHRHFHKAQTDCGTSHLVRKTVRQLDTERGPVFLSQSLSARARAEIERWKESASHLPTLYTPILELTAGSLATWGLISSHQSQGLKAAGTSLPTSPSLARPEGDH